MRRNHRGGAVASVAMAALLIVTASTPAALAQWLGGGPCGDLPGGDGQGATGGTYAEICQGTGVVFVGPAVGQEVAVIGPRLVGPVNGVGSVNTSAGDIAGNSGSATMPL